MFSNELTRYFLKLNVRWIIFLQECYFFWCCETMIILKQLWTLRHEKLFPHIQARRVDSHKDPVSHQSRKVAKFNKSNQLVFGENLAKHIWDVYRFWHRFFFFVVFFSLAQLVLPIEFGSPPSMGRKNQLWQDWWSWFDYGARQSALCGSSCEILVAQIDKKIGL